MNTRGQQIHTSIEKKLKREITEEEFLDSIAFYKALFHLLFANFKCVNDGTCGYIADMESYEEFYKFYFIARDYGYLQ
jgi:hypothetical protein